MEKIKVSVLGASGLVGKKMLEIMSSDPSFTLVNIYANSNSFKKLGDVNYSPFIRSDWLNKELLPLEQAKGDIGKLDFFLSALPGGITRKIEENLRNHGARIVSNASNFRMDKDVPLLVPEIISDESKFLNLIRDQEKKYGGFIVTNPNCATIGIVLSTFPLIERYGLKELVVTTFQAISGAGQKGLYALSIHNNLIPFIKNEEEKIKKEFPKIMSLSNIQLIESFNIYPRTVRVNVEESHSFSIFIRTEKEHHIATEKDFKSLYEDYQNRAKFVYKKPMYYFLDANNLTPKTFSNLNYGFSTGLGRLNIIDSNTFMFFSVSNNLIRGAAGGTILVAKILKQFI